ncbi:38051_t:CDS:2, partial [Gigaspora margarita]
RTTAEAGLFLNRMKDRSLPATIKTMGLEFACKRSDHLTRLDISLLEIDEREERKAIEHNSLRVEVLRILEKRKCKSKYEGIGLDKHEYEFDLFEVKNI